MTIPHQTNIERMMASATARSYNAFHRSYSRKTNIPLSMNVLFTLDIYIVPVIAITSLNNAFGHVLNRKLCLPLE